MKAYYDKHFPPAWKALYDKIKDNTVLTVSDNLDYLAENGVRVVPKMEKIFRPLFAMTPSQVRVVILADEPYNNIYKKTGKPNATGVAFEVPDRHEIPSKLKNLRSMCPNALQGNADLRNGNMLTWLQQGVLLVNASCTAELNRKNAHTYMWSAFPRELLVFLSHHHDNIVFIFWDSEVATCASYVKRKKSHCVLKKHAKKDDEDEKLDLLEKCNAYLRKNKVLCEYGDEIYW